MTETPGWSSGPGEPPPYGSNQPPAQPAPEGAPGARVPPDAGVPPDGGGAGGAGGSPYGGGASGYGGAPPGSPQYEQEFRPQLDIDYPARQRRLTVAFRWLLLIPHFVVLYFVSIAAFVVTVIGWFGALILGRLPGWCGEFLSGYVCWTVRVRASSMLLVDRYPDFGFPAQDGATGIELRPGGRLNRAAVLFRYFLAIPANIVGAVLNIGWFVAAFFVWVATLILGRNPRPAWEAAAVVLRYWLRQESYWTMLTAAYPLHDVFGDPEPIAEPAWPEPDPSQTSAYGDATAVPPAEDAPAPVPPIPGPVSDAGQAAGASDTRPLVLSSGGRTLAIVFVVLGVLGYVGIGVGNGLSSTGAEQAHVAHRQTKTDYNSYARGIHDASQRIASCNDASCVQQQFASIRDRARTLARQVGDIDYPDDAQGDAQTLKSDVQQVAQAADRFTNVRTPLELQRLLTSTHFQQRVRQADSAVRDVLDTLKPSS
jgi:hypothetical protein